MPPEEYLVDGLAISSSHILDIRNTLEAALYLETAYACIHHLLQRVHAIHIPQREEMTLGSKHLAMGIREHEGKTAKLCTLPTIGRTAETILRGITPAAVTDTQGAMHKGFKGHLGHLAMYLCHLLQREFAGKHRLLETQALQPLHLSGSAIIHLCACMQGYGRKIHLQQGQVLHNQSVHTSPV